MGDTRARRQRQREQNRLRAAAARKARENGEVSVATNEHARSAADKEDEEEVLPSPENSMEIMETAISACDIGRTSLSPRPPVIDSKEQWPPCSETTTTPPAPVSIRPRVRLPCDAGQAASLQAEAILHAALPSRPTNTFRDSLSALQSSGDQSRAAQPSRADGHGHPKSPKLLGLSGNSMNNGLLQAPVKPRPFKRRPRAEDFWSSDEDDRELPAKRHAIAVDVACQSLKVDSLALLRPQRSQATSQHDQAIGEQAILESHVNSNKSHGNELLDHVDKFMKQLRESQTSEGEVAISSAGDKRKADDRTNKDSGHSTTSTAQPGEYSYKEFDDTDNDMHPERKENLSPTPNFPTLKRQGADHDSESDSEHKEPERKKTRPRRRKRKVPQTSPDLDQHGTTTQLSTLKNENLDTATTPPTLKRQVEDHDNESGLIHKQPKRKKARHKSRTRNTHGTSSDAGQHDTTTQLSTPVPKSQQPGRVKPQAGFSKFDSLPGDVQDIILGMLLQSEDPMRMKINWLVPRLPQGTKVPSTTMSFIKGSSRLITTKYYLKSRRTFQAQLDRFKTTLEQAPYHSQQPRTRITPALSLLYVSKAISERAAKVFYSENVFEIGGAHAWLYLEVFLATIGPRNVGHLQHLRVSGPKWYPNAFKDAVTGVLLDYMKPSIAAARGPEPVQDRLFSAIANCTQSLARGGGLQSLEIKITCTEVRTFLNFQAENWHCILSDAEQAEHAKRKDEGVHLFRAMSAALGADCKPLLVVYTGEEISWLLRGAGERLLAEKFESLVDEAEKYGWDVEEEMREIE